ncbi:MAG TPA: ABC transporter substrate-binding protein [Alphaproteobacteria bacterium]|nr:ABC transporter substrate-binding protein [Alphaproteobacteria bacterium]
MAHRGSIIKRRPLIAGIGLAFLISASLTGQASAFAAGAPSQFIKDLGENAITMVRNPDLSHEEKTKRFRALLEKGFALKPIARFVLGRYWREASDAQRQRYVKLFEDYIVNSYSARFNEYEGETFKVLGEHSNGKEAAVVTTKVDRPKGGEPVKVDWHVHDYNGELKIVDVVIEGVSMSVTQRSDFAGAIRQYGGNLDAFLDALQKKVNSY